MRQNHRALARTFKRTNDMQQESIVAIFLRRHAIGKALIEIVMRIKAIAPGFRGEGRISDHEIERLED